VWTTANVQALAALPAAEDDELLEAEPLELLDALLAEDSDDFDPEEPLESDDVEAVELPASELLDEVEAAGELALEPLRLSVR
jgi:hypothetical protein